MSHNVLRSCAFGGGHWLAWSSDDFGGRFFCAHHQRQLFEGFSPQAGDQVRMISGAYGDQTFVVLAREGDSLTLRPLGSPEAPSFTRSVGSCWPSGLGGLRGPCRRK